MTDQEFRLRLLQLTYEQSKIVGGLPMQASDYAKAFTGESGEALMLRITNGLSYLAGAGLITSKVVNTLSMHFPLHMVTSVTARGTDLVEGRGSDLGVIGPQAIHFHAPVGTAQVGNQNVAYITQNVGSDIRPLIDALLELHEQIAGDSRLRYVGVLAGSAIEEAQCHGVTDNLKGTLAGIGALVQTLGAAAPAYALLRAAATALGIQGLPTPPGAQ